MMGERHALLIGTDRFEDPELSTLLAPVADIEALSEVLRDPDICDFASAPVLLNPGIVELQKALRTLFNDRAADDLLLLYYTGHGLRDADSGTLYLALHETMKAEPSIGSLEADYVRKRMKASLAGTQIIVLDCCHSGAFMADASKGAKGQPSYVEVRDAFDTGGSGHYIMSACSKSEAAFEDRREKPQSIFTQYLVDGLRTGDAAPDQDAITIDALYKYTRKQVIDRKWPMDPQRWITSGSGDPVIARNPNIRKDVPKELRDMLLTGDKYQQLGAVQQLQALAELGNASYTARKALDVLREGLKASDWVSVQDAIRAVPGVQETRPPPMNAVLLMPDRTAADKTVQQPLSPAARAPGLLLFRSWLSPIVRSTNATAFRLTFLAAIFIPMAIVYSTSHWGQWWAAVSAIVSDTTKTPASDSLQDSLPDGTLGPHMVVIPAGSFMMGSPDGEMYRQSGEGPQHLVSIAKPFAVGQFEVTFNDWQACVEGGGCKSNRDPSDQGFGRGRHPVINVSWYDAQEYVNWISDRTGKTYRLLSEAEWEYSARATTTTAYSTGDRIAKTQAQFGDSSGTAQVGSFPANAFGLHDMHGNVWEWVSDCYVGTYAGAPVDGSARGDRVGCDSVSRGGGWDVNAQYLRSAFRGLARPKDRYGVRGFRVAKNL
jgi:formylglycine-generating enzyme required for sulfatase activity